MMNSGTTTVDEVKDLIVQTLALDDPDRIESASTALFGSMPELDSMAVVNLIMALESRFGFAIDDTEFTADVFETVGSLAKYVEGNRCQ
jgi:acyl carrier protein